MLAVFAPGQAWEIGAELVGSWPICAGTTPRADVASVRKEERGNDWCLMGILMNVQQSVPRELLQIGAVFLEPPTNGAGPAPAGPAPVNGAACSAGCSIIHWSCCSSIMVELNELSPGESDHDGSAMLILAFLDDKVKFK